MEIKVNRKISEVQAYQFEQIFIKKRCLEKERTEELENYLRTEESKKKETKQEKAFSVAEDKKQVQSIPKFDMLTRQVFNF